MRSDEMDIATIALIVVGIILVFFLFRNPAHTIRILGNGAIRLTIGVLLLFFFNVFGGYIGLHIPINIFTVLVSSILGIFGITSLSAIHIFIL